MADRKVCVVTFTWTSPAEDAERDLEGVLAGHLSPFDFATTTVDSHVEDMTKQEAADNVIYLYGEGGRYAHDPDDVA